MGRDRFRFSLAVLAFGAGPCLYAGSIAGTVSAPKPADVVIYIEKAPGTFKGTKAEMNQQNKTFIPYVLPVLQGTTVNFDNDDNLQHNVFGIGAEEFNLGNWTKGIIRQHTFSKPGDVAILCNVHPEMEGHILVLQNPYFARPDSSGKFVIPNVPAGQYVLRAWYRGKTKKQNITVPIKGTVPATF